MAKRENDLTERTLADKADGIGDKFGAAELGKRSKITPAKPPKKGEKAAPATRHPTLAERNRPPAPPRPATTEELARRHAASLSTNLHAKSGYPTLAERVAAEGFAAYTGKQTKPKK